MLFVFFSDLREGVTRPLRGLVADFVHLRVFFPLVHTGGNAADLSDNGRRDIANSDTIERRVFP